MARYTKKPPQKKTSTSNTDFVEKVKNNKARRRRKWGPSTEKSLRRIQRAASRQHQKEAANKQHSRTG